MLLYKYQNGGLFYTDKRAFVDSTLNANKNLDFVKRLLEVNTKSIPTPSNIPGSKGNVSTHLMGWNGKTKIAPHIVNVNNKLKYLQSEDERDEYAEKTGEFIEFKNPEQAKWFAANGYKKGTNVLRKK